MAWDASVLPGLAGLVEGAPPVSVTVTARVVNCLGQLYNRGNAVFGCPGAPACQDTRTGSGGALATVEFVQKRPYLDFGLSPASPV